MANAKTWRIKKWWMSKFEDFLRASSAGHLAVGLIRVGSWALTSPNLPSDLIEERELMCYYIDWLKQIKKEK